MKKYFIISASLFFFFLQITFAWFCQTIWDSYLLEKTKETKILYSSSFLNKVIYFPLKVKSIKKLKTIDSCFSNKKYSLKEIKFRDFLIIDKIKIIINGVFILFILVLPLVILFFISKKIKNIFIRVILDLLIIIYLIFIFIINIIYLI